MLEEGYYLVGQQLVHDRTRFWPSDNRGGNLIYWSSFEISLKVAYEDDASDSDYQYDISTESEERD